jgi:hypothetical protein
MEAILIDAEHPQRLLAGFFGRRVYGVALLPENLDGPQEGTRHLLPANEVAPLIDQYRQVAVAVDPTSIEVADDGLGRRPDGDPLLEILASRPRHPGYLRIEALDVFGLFP